MLILIVDTDSDCTGLHLAGPAQAMQQASLVLCCAVLCCAVLCCAVLHGSLLAFSFCCQMVVYQMGSSGDKRQQVEVECCSRCCLPARKRGGGGGGEMAGWSG